jgi:hypothetical protein
MPLISHFYGILIYIFSEKDGKHHTPHFHAKYAEYRAVFDLEGNIMEGDLPKAKRRLIEAWCEIHKEELSAAWEAWNESEYILKIEGLK